MREVLGTLLRVLFFRASREELSNLDRRHLALGLACTWLVGMGRYWDAPGAHLAQQLGLGSVAYVFVLSAFLWAFLRPLASPGLSYARLLTFVTLVSPPAILYAIPVERFTALPTARTINVWFLAVVALWRVALLAFFLVRQTRLRWYAILVGTALPLSFLVTGLTALNLERAVFDIMSGTEGPGTANDGAYAVLFSITLFSMLAFVPLAVMYLAMLFVARGALLDKPDPLP